MNVLIITAHPASWGFTHKVAQAYKKESEKYGNRVFVMDLYKKKYEQPFLKFEDIKEDWVITPTHKKIQAKVLWANEIVLAFPIWWFGMPGILKNFLDQNITSGFAYKYHKGGRLEKLLTGKTARIFATSDGPRWAHFFFRIAMIQFWGKGILDFCGIELISFDIFADMFNRKDEKIRARMLERVRSRVRESH